mgnify:CR=1 FL=1
MKEYKILAEKEIESVKRNFTDNTNSFKGLAEQLESFKEILVALDIKLKDLGNDFVSKNSLSETVKSVLKFSSSGRTTFFSCW